MSLEAGKASVTFAADNLDDFARALAMLRETAPEPRGTPLVGELVELQAQPLELTDDQLHHLAVLITRELTKQQQYQRAEALGYTASGALVQLDKIIAGLRPRGDYVTLTMVQQRMQQWAEEMNDLLTGPERQPS